MIDQSEQARRLRAAVAYSTRTEPEIANDLGIGVRTLGRWKTRGIPHDGDPRIIRKIAQACGVPYAWFTADYTRLWQIPASPEDGFNEGAAGGDLPPSGPR